MKAMITKFMPNFFISFLLVLSYSALAAPIITNVSPLRVTTGSTVTIIGTGFSPSATVKVGGLSSNFSYKSRTSTVIEIVIAGNVSGNIEVTLASNSGTSTQTITYVAPVDKGTSANIKVDRIFTDYNGFWSSNTASSSPADQPNTRHNLLGFEYRGTVYSTKVDDAVLTANGINFTPQYYRAFSTRGVAGKTHGGLFLAMADLIDGTAHTALGDPNSPEIAGLTSYDVLVDGINGLDLGTGVTNFNSQATVNFSSDNVQPGPSNSFFTDVIPDVLLTQIADPSGSDLYYFVDAIGNVVGTPVRITMSNFSAIGRYRLDLFKFPDNADISTAIPNGNRPVDSRVRDIRILGLRFADFNINGSNYTDVYSLSMAAGGGADLAFMAYNVASFEIPAPHVVSAPNPISICQLPYSENVTFTVNAGVDGGGDTSGLHYKWKKNNIAIPGAEGIGDAYKSYTIPGPINTSSFATYKVEIYNSHGAIVAASAILKLGGTPAVWNGSSWNNPPTATSSLIFTEDYNTDINLPGNELHGCDCTVNNDVHVTIGSGDSMIIQNEVKVAAIIPAHNETIYNEETGTNETVHVTERPAGTLTIENRGSLVQINETAANTGVVRSKRTATNLKVHDYVYWSSPVKTFNISNIPNGPRYKWDPIISNPSGSHGNWVSASGNMSIGRGYISRVSSASNFTVNFVGEPNNGVITKTISGVNSSNTSIDNWNLLGNPYPSPINVDAFLLTNTDIEGTVRLWTHGSPVSNSYTNPFYSNFGSNYNVNDYLLYNGTASVPAGFDGYIASGQGFFVKGLTNTGKVTFNNLLRYKSGKHAYDNSQFYRSGSFNETEKSVIWLSMFNESTNVAASIAVGYVDGATVHKDRLFDTLTEETDGLNFYSILDSEEKLTIQGRPVPFIDDDTVALGFKTSSNGLYSVAIDKVSGIFETGQNIYLEDTYLNITHDLRAAPYNFTTTEGSIQNRFILRYMNTTLGTNNPKDTETFAYIKDDVFMVKAVEDIQAITIFDVTGKKVENYTLNGKSRKEFSNQFQYSKGVYIVQVVLDNNQIVTKKIIK